MYCPVCQSDYPADWKACPKDAASLLPSANIGKYRIEGMLGVGGMGAVYKATNPDIKGSRVAIKLMNPAVAGAEQTRERFKREAAAVAALRTAHVVKVYDFNAEPDGTLYLVMELLDGHALRDEIMPSPDFMDLARVQMVMEGALKGLAAAHKVGIVHRDLKPENIYVADTDDGEVPKLLDFGIARVRTEGKNLTHTGSLMGTASYMATEQIAAGVGEIGPWSDVYAMGAILYEMLAGAPAFGGNTVTEVLQRVLKAECVPLATVRPGLPPSVYALVERCMSNQPATRPQDAEAMRIALSAARLVPLGTQIPPPTKTRVDQAPPPHAQTPGGTALGVMATAASQVTPPKLTPAPQLTPPSGGSTPSIPATGGIVGGNSGVSAFGPTVGNTSSPTASGKPKSKLPLILGGVAVVGVGTVVAVVVAGGGGDKKDHKKDPIDAGLVAQVDAAAPLDAAIAVDAAAAKPAWQETMVHFVAGKHVLGEDPKPNPDAFPKATYDVHEFWIDKEEMRLGDLRAALGDPKIGGAAGDTPKTPSRNVSWADAAKACAAFGKRLPTDQEWELAASTTPNKKEIALLKDHEPAVLHAPDHAGCSPTLCDCSADGLCDMLGGVIEWTSDGTEKKKVVRGSGFTVSPAEAWMATAHFRALVDPTADSEVGFRCAWNLAAGDPLAEEPRVTPKPAGAKPDAPKTGDAPKPPAKPKCEDRETMFHAARDQFQAGQMAVAISKAEAAAACFPDDDRNQMTIGLAACRSRNAIKAKAAYTKVDGRQKRNGLRMACTREGIELEP